MEEPELVVLLDDSGAAIGTAPKADVHHSETPLHLAFSCYLFDEHGRVLLTRRSLEKVAWPGVWTNSFCGHPGANEDIEAAIHRRAAEELGAVVTDIKVVEPNFRYRATDASGIVENEICPVYFARLGGTLSPNPSEVMDVAWASPEDVGDSISHTPFAFSPWMVEQFPHVFDAV